MRGKTSNAGSGRSLLVFERRASTADYRRSPSPYRREPMNSRSTYQNISATEAKSASEAAT